MGSPVDDRPTLGEWAQFRDGVFGDPYLVWHDGPDFTALLTLCRKQRVTVERMLRTGIEAGDPLAAQSVAALATQGQAPTDSPAVLRAAAHDAHGTFAVRVAQALFALTADQSMATPIAAVLLTAPHWTERIDAAMALADFAATPHLVDVLAQAVQDSEYLVRYHAANTLLRYAGRPGEIAEHRDLFAKIITPSAGEASTADRSAWHDVAVDLSAAALADR